MMKLDDEMQALLLLSFLLDSWEILVVSLSNFASKTELAMSSVKDAIFNEEARSKEAGTNQTHALVTESRGRPRKQQ